MQSLDIRLFRTAIIEVVNQYNLPLEVKRYVVKEVLDDITELATNEIEQQYNNLSTEQEDENGESIQSDSQEGSGSMV